MKITTILGINPGFRFIEDDTALAIRESLVAGTRGTVLLGIPFLRRALRDFDYGPMLALICAHECGYILQFEHGIFERIDPQNRFRISDLLADYIAGYCMSKLQFQQSPLARTAMEFMRDSSSRMKSSLIIEARMTAFQQGFTAGSTAIPLGVAVEQGLSFARASAS